MGILHEQETNSPQLTSDPFPHLPQRDPPPYAYSALTPTVSQPATPPATPPPAPVTSTEVKTVLVPPTDLDSARDSQVLGTTTELPVRVLDSRDPLSTCDARFADIILTHVIIPRLRVGVLRWKDRETFEFVPQTKEDRKAKIRRTKHDAELGFLASQYTFRFHLVEALVERELEKAGLKVKKLRLKEKKKEGIRVEWKLKQEKGWKRKGERRTHGGCCGI